MSAETTSSAAEGTGRELSQVQVCEIRKAFILADTDGSGHIDKAELAKCVEMLVGDSSSDGKGTSSVVSPAEIDALFQAMDTNGDGVIEWSEFLEAMRGWFFSDFSTDSGASGGGERARGEVHNRISAFFKQFRPDSEFQAIRSQVQASDDGFQDDDGGMLVDQSGETLSSQQKLEFLQQFRLTMQQNLTAVLTAFVTPPQTGVQIGLGVLSANAQQQQQLEATGVVSRLLSIVKVFATPQERRAVATDVAAIFNVILENQLIRPIVQTLSSTSSADMQFELLNIITYLLPGPRIPSAPRDSLAHPDSIHFKQIFLQEGLLQVLFGLMQSSPLQEIRTNCCFALGALIAHHAEVRDLVLQQGGLPILLSMIHSTSPVELLRPLSKVLAIFCGVTHPAGKLPPFDWIAEGLQSMTSLLFSSDAQIVVNLCPALAVVLPGIPEMTVCRQLVNLLKASIQHQIGGAAHMQVRLQVGLIRCITNLVRYDNVQTQIFVNNCSLLLVLRTVLDESSDRDVRLEACDFLLVLAGVKGEIHAMIEAGLIPRMITLMKVDDYLKPKLVKVLKYVSRGAPQHVAYCVKNGLVTALSDSLSYFKTFDRVLTRVYKYVGPTYNFEFARDVVVALDNIVNVGEVEAESNRLQMSPQLRRSTEPAANPYALRYFDLDAIHHLAHVLDEIAENPDRTEVDAWRQHRPGDTTLEEKIRVLIWKVAKVHVDAGSTDSATMSRMVEGIFRKHFGWTGAAVEPDAEMATSEAVAQDLRESSGVNDLVLVKADMNGDIRIMQIDTKTIKFREFVKSLEFKFKIDSTSPGAKLKLTFLDDDNDRVTISDDASLQLALESAKMRGNQRTVRIFVEKFEFPKQSTVSTSAVEATRARPGVKRDRTMQDTEAKNDRLHQEQQVSTETAASTSLSNPPDASKISRVGSISDIGLVKKDIAQLDLGDVKTYQKAGMFDDLSHTHFGTQELSRMQEKWQQQSPSGEISRAQFTEGLKSIGVTDPLVIEQYFSAFDHDGDGSIDFTEFVTGLSVVQRGSVDERLRFMFNAYDSDKNNVLTVDELYKLVKALYAVRGDEIIYDNARLNKVVTDTFAAVDEDGNGEIDYSEFSKAVHENILPIADLFVNIEF